jgi:hypothetical protein
MLNKPFISKYWGNIFASKILPVGNQITNSNQVKFCSCFNFNNDTKNTLENTGKTHNSIFIEIPKLLNEM